VFVPRANDRSAAFGLHGNKARKALREQSHRLQFANRFVNADQADAATGRIQNDVRNVPFELLDQLEAQRLLAFDAIGFFQRRSVVESVFGHRFADDRAGVTDKPVDQPNVRARGDALEPVDRRRALRHDHVCFDSSARTVSSPRSAGVSIGGHCKRIHAQLARARNADRRTTRFERRGRQQSFVLYEEPL